MPPFFVLYCQKRHLSWHKAPSGTLGFRIYAQMTFEKVYRREVRVGDIKIVYP